MPVSSLITHPLHTDSRQSCFGGVWYNPSEQAVWNSPRLKVYVAPVNIDYIKARFPKESPALAAQFRPCALWTLLCEMLTIASGL